MNTGFLYGTNELIIFAIFFAFMLTAAEIGLRLRQRSGENQVTRPHGGGGDIGGARFIVGIHYVHGGNPV